MTAPLEDFLRSTSAMVAALSPDGSRLAFLWNETGIAQAYVVAVDGSSPARQVTHGTDRVSGLVWSPTDPDLVVFARDAGGNENHQLYLLRLSTGDVEAITDDPAAMHTPGGWSRDGELFAFTTNRRNGTDFDIVVRSLASGRERVVWDRGGYNARAGFSPTGQWFSVIKATSNADSDCYLVDVSGSADDAWWSSSEPLATRHMSAHEGVAKAGAPRWIDDSSYLFASDIDTDVTTLRHCSVASGAITPLLASEWEVEDAATSWDGSRVAVTVNAEGYSEVAVYAVSGVALERLPDPKLPAGQVDSLRWSQDGSRLTFTGYSPTRAMNAWVWDAASDVSWAVSTAAFAVPSSELVEPDLVRFTSFDGLSVPFFRYQPATPSSSPRPVVIEIHGGPEGQSRPIFNPLMQFLVARGYVVLSPNVRGSSGYGKAYMALDDIELRLDSVADLAALHAWIDAEPTLDASRVALYGGSYGGYMVLAGLAFYPSLWAAGIDIVGIANLETFLENTSSYRRALRECEYGYLATDREFLRKASPVHRVDDMRAPLLIIHGANDPRVPLSEASQMHAALEARGITTKLLVYADEGHGLAKLANRLDAYPQVAEFLDGVLG